MAKSTERVAARLKYLLLCIVLLAGCSAPNSVDYFVKSADRDALGRFPFTLDLRDSLRLYSINFLTRMDLDQAAFESMGDVAVDVLLVSPSGENYGERVYLDLDDFCHNGFTAKDYDMPYRTGFRVAEPGIWMMYLTLQDCADKVCGMGVRLKWEKYGKR